MAGMLRGETKLITYAFFHIGARAALTSAEEIEDGRSYNLLNAMVLSSFFVEAYFNHLGDELGYPEWNTGVDKKTSIWKKYKLLRSKVGLSESGLDLVYPLVKDTIEFRNTMAHGRTETHVFVREVEGMEFPHREQTDVGWQTQLTNSKVRACFDSCRQLIYELHSAAGLGNHPFTKLSSSIMGYKES
ncbi:hypothetical protein [Pseudomonas yamanorum]|uniref:hypothetical protein n=1 Tax=Pseudomonas yamanorum TaxID=515393 RepID=UPI003BA1E857